MAWSLGNITSQVGRVAIVTGANGGLGYDTALVLAQHGAEVVMACRNLDKAEVARLKIIAQTGNSKVFVRELDLSSLASVRAFAYGFLTDYSQLDLLINNAGIMMPPRSLSVDGFESQIATNYTGHFLLTALLLDMLEKTAGSRIVSLSSLAHKTGEINLEDIHFERDYNPVKAYGQSKLACLMFAFELQRQLTKNDCQTLSVAAHPGISMTNLDQHLSSFSSFMFKLFCQPPEKGVLPTLYAALGNDIVGGDFCGPGGLFEVRGNPKKVHAKKQAYDLEIAKKLWSLSETMTEMDNFIPRKL